jgi:hypothetical protein
VAWKGLDLAGGWQLLKLAHVLNPDGQREGCRPNSLRDCRRSTNAETLNIAQ